VDEIVKALVNQVGGTVILVILITFYFVDKFGLVKIFAEKMDIGRKAKFDQAHMLQTWQNDFVENLRKEVADCRQQREIDQEECEKKLEEMIEDIATWRKDSAKWRHLSGNLAMFVNRLRVMLINNQIPVPRFDAWDKFVEEGGTKDDFNFDPKNDEPERGQIE